MTEKSAKYAIATFAFVSEVLVPVSELLDMAPLNPTVFAGATLVLLYLNANPQLLLSTRSETKEHLRRGVAIPLALYLGGLLMILGLLMHWVSANAS